VADTEIGRGMMAVAEAVKKRRGAEKKFTPDGDDFHIIPEWHAAGVDRGSANSVSVIESSS